MWLIDTGFHISPLTMATIVFKISTVLMDQLLRNIKLLYDLNASLSSKEAFADEKSMFMYCPVTPSCGAWLIRLS